MTDTSDAFVYAATPHPLEERAQRQQEVYWRVRTQKTLARLADESRRMLRLEAELSDFAEQYYHVVGEHVERLNALESMLAPQPEVAPPTLHEVQAQRLMQQARRREVKSRYRTLAKEIHPDRHMTTQQNPIREERMQTLNAAYTSNDLSALLRLEAEVLLEQPLGAPLEARLREIERAADTYAAGYRQLLHSPLNELMLRQMVARLAGWNWMEAVVARIQRSISDHERALAQASIAAIGDWRQKAQAA